MADYFDSLAQKFLNKSSLQDCNVDEVRNIARQYPYFAPAHFLLLKKLDKNSEEYRQQYSKAILYYSNPLEFEQLFHPEKWNTSIDLDIEEDEDLYEETSIANEIIEEDLKEENIEEQELAKDEVDVFSDDTTDVDSVSNNEIEQNDEEPLVDKDENAPEPEVEEIENNEDRNIITNIEEKADDEGNTVNDIELSEEEMDNLPPLPKIEIKEIAPDENALTFEPYHTVDYFASQGIKLNQEANTNDKFGKQLKSFTEWLKTMKRLPANKVAGNIDPNTEKKVENLASHSVEDPNIITEAMAEVWEKQGNIEKAIEVYNKLSLSNPSKNAYFAAKIQNLKNQS